MQSNRKWQSNTFAPSVCKKLIVVSPLCVIKRFTSSWIKSSTCLSVVSLTQSSAQRSNQLPPTASILWNTWVTWKSWAAWTVLFMPSVRWRCQKSSAGDRATRQRVAGSTPAQQLLPARRQPELFTEAVLTEALKTKSTFQSTERPKITHHTYSGHITGKWVDVISLQRRRRGTEDRISFLQNHLWPSTFVFMLPIWSLILHFIQVFSTFCASFCSHSSPLSNTLPTTFCCCFPHLPEKKWLMDLHFYCAFPVYWWLKALYNTVTFTHWRWRLQGANLLITIYLGILLKDHPTCSQRSWGFKQVTLWLLDDLLHLLSYSCSLTGKSWIKMYLYKYNDGIWNIFPQHVKAN